MCIEGGPRDISPKEKMQEQVLALMDRAGFTMKDLKAVCEPGVLDGILSKLRGVDSHEKS